MSNERKFIIAAAVVTLVIIVGGVFLLGRPKEKVLSDKIDQSLILNDVKHSIGNPDARVKIVEFGDYQCPACAAVDPTIKQIIEKNSDKIYFVFRHFPLPTHKNARVAAKAVEAAGEQGKYWEMHGTVYQKQSEWSQENDAKAKFEAFAKDLGLDQEKFKQDMDKSWDNIQSDYALGNENAVNSTPTFFINGKRQAGGLTFEAFQKLIDEEAAK